MWTDVSGVLCLSVGVSLAAETENETRSGSWTNQILIISSFVSCLSVYQSSQTCTLEERMSCWIRTSRVKMLQRLSSVSVFLSLSREARVVVLVLAFGGGLPGGRRW